MFNKKMQFLAFILVSAMLLSVCMPVAFASETTKAAASPDLTAIIGSTGGKIGGASVYLDDKLAGKTDSKGNFTFAEAPAVGNHTIKVTAKGMKDATLSADFSHKPVAVAMTLAKGGKNMTLHVVDGKSKEALGGVSVYNGKYLMGESDASGDIVVKDVPLGIYLVKFHKEGYKDTTSIMIALADRKQSYSLTPAATEHKAE